MTDLELEQFINSFEELFEEMITHQQDKVLGLARQRLSHLTGDDILNPHDFPELARDPIFNYEEGMASGMMATQIAIRARLLRPWKDRKYVKSD